MPQQELPSTVAPTPGDAVKITPIIKRSLTERLYDVFLVGCAFALALLQALGDINWASLGLGPTQAAWAGLVLTVIRFWLSWRSVRLVQTKVEPAPPVSKGEV